MDNNSNLNKIKKGLIDLKTAFCLHDDFKEISEYFDELVEKCDEPLQVMIMGAFSTGKSSFINAIIGEKLAIVGALPTTAVITKICYGKKNGVKVNYKNGKEEFFEEEKFKALTSESDKNWADIHNTIEYVTFYTENEILKKINIIDSPGLDDINESHNKATKRFVNKADVVFWVFSAEGALTTKELDSLNDLDTRLKPIAIVNKIDIIDEEDEDDSIEDFLNDIRKKLGDRISEVIGVSARDALDGKLNSNTELIEESNIGAVEKFIDTIIIPNTETYKIDSITEILSVGFVLFKKIIDIYKEKAKNEKEYEEELRIKEILLKINESLTTLASIMSKYISPKVREGNVTAYLLEATMYMTGILYSEDAEKAITLYEYAAMKKNIFAQYILVKYYLEEKNDLSKAKYWAEKFNKYYVEDVDLKDLEGEILTILASLYMRDAEECGDEKIYVKAIKLLERALEAGEEGAANQLGYLYQNGLGVEKDAKKAYSYYEKAANKGLADAEYNLGYLLFIGEGCEQDLPTAMQWIEKAAAKKQLAAMSSLAGSYIKGNVPGYDDVEKGMKWQEELAELDDDAKVALVELYGRGIEGRIEPDFDKALEYANSHIDVKGMKSRLAGCYLANGEIDKAIPLFETALAEGDEEIRCLLAEAYYMGNESELEPNYKRATELLESVLEDNPEAQYIYGDMYILGGYGIEEDVNKGLYWINRSAESSYTMAMNLLGKIYGIYSVVPNDYEKAIYWLEKATESGDSSSEELLNIVKQIKYIKETINVTIDYDEDIKECDVYLREEIKNDQKELQNIINENRDSNSPWYKTDIKFNAKYEQYIKICRVIGMYVTPSEAAGLYPYLQNAKDEKNVIALLLLDLFYDTDIDKTVESEKNTVMKFGSYVFRTRASSIIGDENDPFIMEFYFPSDIDCDPRIKNKIPKISSELNQNTKKEIEIYQKKIMDIIEKNRSSADRWIDKESSIDKCVKEKNDYAKLCRRFGMRVVPSEAEHLYPIIKKDANNGEIAALSAYERYSKLYVVDELDSKFNLSNIKVSAITASTRVNKCCPGDIDYYFPNRIKTTDEIEKKINIIKEKQEELERLENNKNNSGCMVWLVIPPVAMISALYYMLS